MLSNVDANSVIKPPFALVKQNSGFLLLRILQLLAPAPLLDEHPLLLHDGLFHLLAKLAFFGQFPRHVFLRGLDGDGSLLLLCEHFLTLILLKERLSLLFLLTLKPSLLRSPSQIRFLS